MPCPPEVAEAAPGDAELGSPAHPYGRSVRADLSAEVADHVHNLPMLLSDSSEERLSYYWNGERPAFQGRLTPERSAGWYEFRERLRRFA